MAKNKLDDNALLGLNGENIAGNAASGVGAEIFSAKPMAKYLSGARCVLRVNGKIIGFAFGISWNIETSAQEIRTIDDPLPYELAPTTMTVTGQITGFRIPGSGPTQSLIQTDMLSFLHQRYIDIEVRDSQTDNLIFKTTKAMITNRTESIKSDALAEMSLSFKAIGWADERAPKFVDGATGPVKPDTASLVDKFLR